MPMSEDQWIYGQAKTRLSYEAYFKANILNVVEHKWIREFYDKTLKELRELINSSSKDSKTHIRLNPIISKISGSGKNTLFTLLDSIAKEENARKFLTKNNLKKEELDNFIYHVRNYLLPRAAQLREYIFADDPRELEYFEILKKHTLDNNLALIETCRTKKGRKEISKKTSVPEKVLLDFANRFSIGRVPFFGGKSVKHMWRAGYRNLKDVRNDSPENMTKRLIEAFKSVGLTIPNDFKKGCKDGTMIQIWKEMPEIIDC
jgi:hypothetical protein